MLTISPRFSGSGPWASQTAVASLIWAASFSAVATYDFERVAGDDRPSPGLVDVIAREQLVALAVQKGRGLRRVTGHGQDLELAAAEVDHLAFPPPIRDPKADVHFVHVPVVVQREAAVHGERTQIGPVEQREPIEFLVVADVIEMQMRGEHGHRQGGDLLDHLADAVDAGSGVEQDRPLSTQDQIIDVVLPVMDLADGEGSLVDLCDLEPLVFRRQGLLRPGRDA